MKLLEKNIDYIDNLQNIETLSDSLRRFLDQPNVQTAFMDADIDKIYYYATRLNNAGLSRDLTLVLYSLNIDPLRSLDYIPKYFLSLSDIKNVSIPDNIKTISDAAFWGCDKLVKALMPNTITSIGEIAFSDCDSLEDIKIPANVNYIGYKAFSRCNSLKNVTLPGNISNMGGAIFSDCNRLYKITISSGITAIRYGFAAGCHSLTEVLIPNTVTEIERDSFWFCSGLHEIKYDGTREMWGEIKKHRLWKTSSSISIIHCTDGDIKL